MAAWITIYLHRAPRDLSPEAIQAGISEADWWTLAEQFDIEDDEVDAFMAAIEWSASPLAITVPGRRPVQVHVWTDPARVAEEIAELDERDLEVPASVHAHLAQVRCIIALEMGFTQLETMFEVVGFEIAYWLAETCGGVILGDDGAWFDHAAHRWNPITA